MALRVIPLLLSGVAGICFILPPPPGSDETAPYTLRHANVGCFRLLAWFLGNAPKKSAPLKTFSALPFMGSPSELPAFYGFPFHRHASKDYFCKEFPFRSGSPGSFPSKSLSFRACARAQSPPFASLGGLEKLRPFLSFPRRERTHLFGFTWSTTACSPADFPFAGRRCRNRTSLLILCTQYS